MIGEPENFLNFWLNTHKKKQKLRFIQILEFWVDPESLSRKIIFFPPPLPCIHFICFLLISLRVISRISLLLFFSRWQIKIKIKKKTLIVIKFFIYTFYFSIYAHPVHTRELGGPNGSRRMVRTTYLKLSRFKHRQTLPAQISGPSSLFFSLPTHNRNGTRENQPHHVLLIFTVLSANEI